MSTAAAPIAAQPELETIQRPVRILELDGVRAIAIALVIGCHYPAFASSLWRIPAFGWIGVEIFFVLSGYLITTNLLALRGNPKAYRTFYTRRARRILPPYILVVVACVGIVKLVTGYLDYGALAIEAMFLKSFLGTGIILRHAFGVAGTSTVPGTVSHANIAVRIALNPTWSLSIEEWFYFLWAPVVLRFRNRGVLTAIALSLVLGGILRGMAHATGIIWYENFFCRLDTLAIGAALALWMNHRRTASSQVVRIGDRLISQVGMLSVVLLAVLLFSIRPILGHEIRKSDAFAAFGMPLIGAAIASALACIILHHSVFRTLRSRPFVYIGRRSYTLYLVHLPIYWTVSAFFAFNPSSSTQWYIALIALPLAIVAAALSWEVIEAPLLRR